MTVNYDKEEQAFIDELETGRFKTGSLPNNGYAYDKTRIDRDIASFDDYLKSESFKTLNNEASK